MMNNTICELIDFIIQIKKGFISIKEQFLNTKNQLKKKKTKEEHSSSNALPNV